MTDPVSLEDLEALDVRSTGLAPVADGLESMTFPVDDEDTEDLVLDIDLEALDSASEEEASDMVRVITDLFYDEDLRKSHPRKFKRIQLEIETLRGLIKMRKTDEKAHDALIKAIIDNKSNPSLYKSMAEIQKTSIAITNKIHDTIDRISQLCTELMDDDHKDNMVLEEDNGMEVGESIHRGTKEFIEEMLSSEQE